MATLEVRVFNGASWETSTCRGQSNPMTEILSGGAATPTYLVHLQAFQVDCIPEPDTVALLSCALIALAWATHRKCDG
jgi:hypothetical protein